jgi:hypothetical protein
MHNEVGFGQGLIHKGLGLGGVAGVCGFHCVCVAGCTIPAILNHHFRLLSSKIHKYTNTQQTEKNITGIGCLRGAYFSSAAAHSPGNPLAKFSAEAASDRGT